MKSFFIQKQLKYFNSKMRGWGLPLRAFTRISLVLLLACIFSSHVIAQFTLNGLPEEWPGILNNAAARQKVFVRDANSTNDNQFTNGSQDPDLLAEWGWVIGQTNDKGDISNAGAALLPGNIIAFFGDRTAINGDAQIGFWFFKADIHPVGDGLSNSVFTTEHQVGDLLVLSNFTNGGGTVQLRIYKWVGSGGSDGSLHLVGTTSNARVNSVPVAIPSAGPFLASQPATATWSYQGKNVPSEGVPPANTYHTGAYFEGFIDLDDIPGASRCIQSFLLETRNSQSTTASLQDFVQGGFNGIPDPPTVVGDEICFGTRNVSLSATCTGSTVKWYTAATGGSAIQTGSPLIRAGLAVGTHTFYASCADGECESARVPVTAIVNPLPDVDGVVTEGENDNSIDDGITKTSDDIYRMRISKTNTASLAATATGGNGSYTYLWTRINCDGSAFVDDGKTTFTSSGANGTFTVLTSLALADAYCFRVRVTDGKTCIAVDEVQIRPTFSCPPCGISGPATKCQNDQATYTYIDPSTNLPGALPADYNLVWTRPDGTTVSNVLSITVTLNTLGTNTASIAFTAKPGGVAIICPGCSKTTDVRQVTLSLAKRDLTCYQSNDGRITATFANGFPPYSISLNGVTTANVTSAHVFNGLAAGAYTVVITDAQNCTDTKQITLTQPNLLTCSLTAPTALTCGSSGTVSGTISGGTAGYTCSAAFDATGTAGGWSVTNCSVTGTGITVSYTSGASVKSAVLTVTVTDANGCTSTCSTTVECTGAHGCTPGFWQGGNGKPLWDEATDLVAIAAGFNTESSFFTVFPGVAPGTCGLPTSLKMIDAINTGGGNCNKLVRHGCAAILNASTLPDYPLPAGIANIAALKTAITNAINSCNCEPLATQLAANNELNHDLCGQVLTSITNSFVSGRTIRADVSDGLVMDAYPNPYNNVVNFRFASPKTGKAVLEVYDIVGRKLAIVYQGSVTAKTPVSVRYNVPSLSRVALFYKLTIDDKSVRGSILPDKQ